jgi:hypothetical protein
MRSEVMHDVFIFLCMGDFGSGTFNGSKEACGYSCSCISGMCIMGVAVFLAVYRLLSAVNKIIVLLQGLIQPMCFASF